MNYAIVENGRLSCFIVNTTFENAEAYVKRNFSREVSLIKVKLKENVPQMFKACIFGRIKGLRLSFWTKVKLWIRGIQW